MNNEEYAELFKYCSPYSILVVTWYGKLKTLNCPFKAIVRTKVGNLASGDYVVVSKVKLSASGKTVYIIDNQAYYYFYFDIQTHL